MSINTAYKSAQSTAEDSSVATLQTLSIIADLASSPQLDTSIFEVITTKEEVTQNQLYRMTHTYQLGKAHSSIRAKKKYI